MALEFILSDIIRKASIEAPSKKTDRVKRCFFLQYQEAMALEIIHSDLIKKEPEVSTFCLLDCIW
ncbi:hypothetical protein BCV73_06880 [Paenibacillus sp. SSG-1]|nr:hypothetical protein BCV73_06880 [Paenibacillus sp. SSG-1]